MSTKAIVLAAGQGTRMKSPLAKVLHRVAGRPMVTWVVDALAAAGVDDVVVVVGHQAEDVAAVLPHGVRTALQEQQLGTGHAAAIGLAALTAGPADTVLVLPGDMPLLEPGTLEELVAVREETGAAAALLVTVLDDPAGYGRIVRRDEAVAGIVEEADASGEQRRIREVNTSVYAFRGDVLGAELDRLRPDNAQGELYLTDVVGALASAGEALVARPCDPVEALGVNSHVHLAEAARIVRRRLTIHWMEAGVWMQDPERVYLDAGVELAPGVRIHPDTHLEGSTVVAAGAEIGPDVYLRDCTVGRDARVWYTVGRGATIGDEVQVGPYASLRDGTVLTERSKAGTFVEMKNTVVGPGSKVPHLSYMGDATIGTDSNIGAGTITCNYDGYRKHATTIGDRVRIGSDTMLVAPVTVHDDAWTGAGSVINKDVSPGALAVERSAQKEIEGYADRRRRAQEDTA